MTDVLLITSSIFLGDGQSSLLAREFARALPHRRLVTRDLAATPLPHLDAERFGALRSDPENRTPQQQRIIDESNALVGELLDADVLVLGLPMYNFGVPSQLKAYFDHIARAGVTFRYTPTGSVGLLTGKRAVVFATRGGSYAGTARDVQTSYVRNFLAFIGVTDVEFVYAEGLAISPEAREAGLAGARSELRALVQSASASSGRFGPAAGVATAAST